MKIDRLTFGTISFDGSVSNMWTRSVTVLTLAYASVS